LPHVTYTSLYMVSIDSRTQGMLKALLQCEEPIAAEELAEKLGLTAKMVRYRLDTLELWLAERDAKLDVRKGRGLSIASPTGVREALLKDVRGLSGYELVLTPSQRQQLLKMMLLLSVDPTIAKRLEGELGVSRSTLFNDLDQVEAWFEKHKLALVRRPGFGIMVKGRERDLREALVGVLLSYMEAEGMFYICSREGDQKLVDFFPPILRQISKIGTFLDSLQLEHARTAISEIEDDLADHFSDNTYTILAFHLMVLFNRYSEQKTVEYSDEMLRMIRKHPSFPATKNALNIVGSEMGLDFTMFEAAYLVTKLIGAQVNHKIGGDMNGIRGDLTSGLAGKLVTNAAEFLGDARLAEDKQIIKELKEYLDSFLQRLRYGLTVSNPLLDEMKRYYPNVYWVSDRLTDLLAKEIDQEIPEEETGYLAMYLRGALERLKAAPKITVLVICPLGKATSQMLASRLEAKFPQFHVADVLSIRKYLEQTNRADCAVIISTVDNLPAKNNVPVIQVNPLLPPEDVQKLQDWLAAKYQDDDELSMGFGPKND